MCRMSYECNNAESFSLHNLLEKYNLIGQEYSNSDSGNIGSLIKVLHGVVEDRSPLLTHLLSNDIWNNDHIDQIHKYVILSNCLSLILRTSGRVVIDSEIEKDISRAVVYEIKCDKGINLERAEDNDLLLIYLAHKFGYVSSDVLKESEDTISINKFDQSNLERNIYQLLINYFPFVNISDDNDGFVSCIMKFVGNLVSGNNTTENYNDEILKTNLIKVNEDLCKGNIIEGLVTLTTILNLILMLSTRNSRNVPSDITDTICNSMMGKEYNHDVWVSYLKHFV